MSSKKAVPAGSGASAAAAEAGNKPPPPPPAPVVADAPMSTTKAHLLSIVVPRVHRVYVANDNDGDEDGGGDDKEVPEVEIVEGSDGNTKKKGLTAALAAGTAESSAADDADPGSSDNDATAAKGVASKDNGDADGGDAQPAAASDATTDETPDNNAAAAAQDGIVGYTAVEGEDSDSSISVEHVVTAEEMATVVKIDPAAEAAEAEAKAKAAETTAAKIKTFFGVMNKDKEEKETVYFSEKEAVAAIKETASSEEVDGEEMMPNTEIKVEALLRLTFKTLLAEGHLFNAPIYTAIKSSSDDDDGDDWVELTVILKAQSTGVVLERLERIGVGSSVGTVSIFKAELCRTAYDYYKNTASESEREGGGSGSEGRGSGDGGRANGTGPSQSERGGPAETAKSKIDAAKAEWKNAASRLRVEQVKEQIAEQATFGFDFLSLLSIASILAGIGLIVDSVVVIVASMLVSPIMGPVMGMTFGSRVNDWGLAKSSAVVEMLALLLAVGIGAAIGLTSSWTEAAQDWPTDEMQSRGDTTGLITGIAIAIPSGMGVALSILGNNTASLVGVAISASLLPPAVNAGVCWVYALLLRAGAVANANANSADFASIGGVSFALTMVNIVCIWLSGMFMFALKEITPTKAKSAFWARDIKIARTVTNTGSPSKEVDLEVIRAGLKSALDKEQKAAATKSDKNGPGAGGAATAKTQWRRKRELRKAAGPRSNVTFNLAVNPVPIDDISQMDEQHVRAIGLEELVEPFPVPRAVPAASLASGSVVGGPAAPAPRLTDDFRYVSLEDMAALLGSDEDDDEEEVAPRTGAWGFGWLGTKN